MVTKLTWAESGIFADENVFLAAGTVHDLHVV